MLSSKFNKKRNMVFNQKAFFQKAGVRRQQTDKNPYAHGHCDLKTKQAKSENITIQPFQKQRCKTSYLK